jgi:glutathione reductase (NADPH)
MPPRIVIGGAGYIAIEFACLFAALGSEVTLVHRGDEILRGFDDDVRHHVRVEMEERGIRLALKRALKTADVGDACLLEKSLGQEIAGGGIVLMKRMHANAIDARVALGGYGLAPGIVPFVANSDPGDTHEHDGRLAIGVHHDAALVVGGPSTVYPRIIDFQT